MTDTLWRWTAKDLSEGIRKREISSREATESCLERLYEVNPIINAVVDLLADEALASADGADEAVRRGEELGCLHGVPITVKINVDFEGRPTTNGVVAFQDLIVEEDSIPVSNLRKAGAIIFGRTNVPAFSTRYFTDNALHGRTLNPWDSRRTPGGSSGGAAAAVAAGIGPIAHGNDRAGSVRQPAFCCGVIGLRPTVGRVPDYNPSSVEDRGVSTQLTHVQGPLARTISDIRIGLEALSARDISDPWWVPVKVEPSCDPVPVAMISSIPGVDFDPAIVAAIKTAGHWLEEAGYSVEEVIPPHFSEVAELFWPLLLAEERAASKETGSLSTSAIEKLGDEAVRRGRASTRAYARKLNYSEYIRGLATRTTIIREWQTFLERYPLILLPVSCHRPWPIDFDQGGDEQVRRMLDSYQTLVAISLLGLPGLSMPTGLVDGVPVGVQIVAAKFHEEQCLVAGEIIEACNDVQTPIDPKQQE